MNLVVKFTSMVCATNYLNYLEIDYGLLRCQSQRPNRYLESGDLWWGRVSLESSQNVCNVSNSSTDHSCSATQYLFTVPMVAGVPALGVFIPCYKFIFFAEVKTQSRMRRSALGSLPA